MNAAVAAEALDHSGLKDIYRVMVRIAEADAAPSVVEGAPVAVTCHVDVAGVAAE